MRQSCGSPIGTLPRRLRQCLWVSRMRATAADFCGSRAAVERWYCRKLFLFAPRVSGSLADEQACVLVAIFWIFVRTFDKHAGLEPSGDHILGLFVGEAWTKFPYQRPSCSFLGIWSRAISSTIGGAGFDAIEDRVDGRRRELGESVRRCPGLDGLDLIAVRIKIGSVADRDTDKSEPSGLCRSADEIDFGAVEADQGSALIGAQPVSVRLVFRHRSEGRAQAEGVFESAGTATSICISRIGGAFSGVMWAADGAIMPNCESRKDLDDEIDRHVVVFADRVDFDKGIEEHSASFAPGDCPFEGGAELPRCHFAMPIQSKLGVSTAYSSDEEITLAAGRRSCFCRTAVGISGAVKLMASDTPVSAKTAEGAFCGEPQR